MCVYVYVCWVLMIVYSVDDRICSLFLVKMWITIDVAKSWCWIVGFLVFNCCWPLGQVSEWIIFSVGVDNFISMTFLKDLIGRVTMFWHPGLRRVRSYSVSCFRV